MTISSLSSNNLRTILTYFSFSSVLQQRWRVLNLFVSVDYRHFEFQVQMGLMLYADLILFIV